MTQSECLRYFKQYAKYAFDPKGFMDAVKKGEITSAFAGGDKWTETALKQREEQAKKLDEKIKSLRDSYFKESAKTYEMAAAAGIDLSPDDLKKMEKTAQSIADANEKLRQKQNEIELQNRQDGLDRKGREIALMKDSEAKKLAEIELNTDKEILALDKQREELIKANNENEKLKWQSKGGKGIFKPTSMLTIQQESDQLKELNLIAAKRFSDRSKIIEESIKTDQAAWNEYIKEFGNSEEKRLAIIREYDQKIKDAQTGGEKALLEGQKQRALSDFDLKEFEKTINFADIFSKIDEKSTAAIDVLRDKIVAYLKQASEKLTPEQVKVLSDAILKMDEVKENRNPFQALTNSVNKYKDALKKLKDAKDEGLDESRIAEYASAVDSALLAVANDIGVLTQQVNQYANTLIPLIEALGGEELADDLNNVLGIVTGTAEAGMGVAKIMAGDMSGIKDLASGISKAVTSLIRFNDVQKEKKIRQYQERIDALTKSYNILSDSVEKAYSKDASKLIEQQNTLLKQQRALIQMQIKEEEAKKKTDKDKIQKWKDELDEIDKLMVENREKAVDAIYGEDIKSAISNFVNAYVNAWESGGDRILAGKNIGKEMIKKAIVEMMKADIDTPMQALREKIADFISDGVISAYEQAYIDKMADEMTNTLDKKYGEWTDKYLKGEQTQDAASRGGYETISESTGIELRGINTDIQMRTHELLAEAKLMNIAQSAILSEMKTNNTLLDEIRMHNENMQELLEKADKRGVNVASDVSDIKGKVSKMTL